MAANQLRRADLQGLLGVVGDAHTHDGPLPFTVELVERLAGLLRCEVVSFLEYDWLHRVIPTEISCSWDPDAGIVPNEDWWEEASPLPPDRYAKGVAIWSDRPDGKSRGPFDGRPSELYSLATRVRDEISIGLDVPATERVSLVFHTLDRIFGERDRQVALALEPHVVALDRNAHARRRLSALLSALDRGDADPGGVLVLARNHSIEDASPVAGDVLERWFGRLHGNHLPSEIDEWLRSGSQRSSLELSRDGRRLVVDAPSEHALLVTEHSAPPVVMTRRERDVLRCIAAGKSTAETAQLLWVTPATVSKHLEHVYSKLGVTSRTAALARLGMTLEAV